MLRRQIAENGKKQWLQYSVVVGANGAHPAVRVVMSNHWIVNEVLTVARQLKTTTYSHVYLSKDRTPEERERHKKCVDELKQKMSDCPDRRWAILRGCVVDKGQFANLSLMDINIV